MRDQVGDNSDVRGRADQWLLFEYLDPNLLDVVEEVSQRSLLGEEELEQAYLELEVVVVGGHDLDSTGGAVEKLPVIIGRRAQRLLDQHHVAEVVVQGKGGQMGHGRRRDVGDHIRAGLELAFQLVVRRE